MDQIEVQEIGEGLLEEVFRELGIITDEDDDEVDVDENDTNGSNDIDSDEEGEGQLRLVLALVLWTIQTSLFQYL